MLCHAWASFTGAIWPTTVEEKSKMNEDLNVLLNRAKIAANNRKREFDKGVSADYYRTVGEYITACDALVNRLDIARIVKFRTPLTLLTQLHDSAQISTLPEWNRKLLLDAAETIEHLISNNMHESVPRNNTQD